MYVNAVGVPKARQLSRVPHGTLTMRGLGDLTSSLGSISGSLPSWAPWAAGALILGILVGPKLHKAAHRTRRAAGSSSAKMLLLGGVAAFAGYYFGKQGGLSSL